MPINTIDPNQQLKNFGDLTLPNDPPMPYPSQWAMPTVSTAPNLNPLPLGIDPNMWGNWLNTRNNIYAGLTPQPMQLPPGAATPTQYVPDAATINQPSPPLPFNTGGLGGLGGLGGAMPTGFGGGSSGGALPTGFGSPSVMSQPDALPTGFGGGASGGSATQPGSTGGLDLNGANWMHMIQQGGEATAGINRMPFMFSNYGAVSNDPAAAYRQMYPDTTLTDYLKNINGASDLIGALTGNGGGDYYYPRAVTDYKEALKKSPTGKDLSDDEMEKMAKQYDMNLFQNGPGGVNPYDLMIGSDYQSSPTGLAQGAAYTRATQSQV